MLFRNCRLLLGLICGVLTAPLSAQQAPGNDAFSNASILSGNLVQTTGSNLGATAENGEPRHAGVGGGKSVWWQWTASSGARTTIDTVGSDYDTVLAVYTGNAVGILSEVASNDDLTGSTASRVRFTAVAGTTYRIAVDGYSNGSTTAQGQIKLNLLSADPAPVIASNPAAGAILNLPPVAFGTSSQAEIDLYATGGAASNPVTLTCSSNQGVRIGPAGAPATANSYSQTVTAGSQPVDLAVALNALVTSLDLPGAVQCIATPATGFSYTLSYRVQLPAGLSAEVSPTISSIPPAGELNLASAPINRDALGSLNLVASPGNGPASVSIQCNANGGLRIGPAGAPPTATQYAQTLTGSAQPRDLALAATAASNAYLATLSCTISPSSGSAYSLNYSVRVPPGVTGSNATWRAIGPGPTNGGQTEGISGPPSNPVAGAVHVVLPHPSNADLLYVGTVNGGVWRTHNAQAELPTWTALTDQQASLSIGALVFDAADASGNTLLAGIGRFSSYGRAGGTRAGVLRSRDGGSSWSALSSTLAGKNVSGITARGNVIVVAANTATSNACADYGLFRSTDGGASFSKLGLPEGLPAGAVTALVNHPSAPQILFAHLDSANVCGGSAQLNGLYRSSDEGASWTRVSNTEMNTLFAGSSKLVRAQVAAGGRIAVAIADSVLRGVFLSTDNGSSWLGLGYPITFEGSDEVGLHPGEQGRLHLSIAIDRSNPNLIYVGGDRQPGSFPNSLGARTFSGRLFRADAATPGSWVSLTHSGTANNSAPHADSRSMAVDAAGRLIEGDDGGVYARTQPASSSGVWISLNGDLQVTEQHSVAFDPIAGIAQSGNQDNGTMRQAAADERQWAVLSGGDGGDTAVDALHSAAQGQSISYTSAQNLGSFRRRVHDATNNAVSVVTPGLIVSAGGASPTGQFTTPLAINRVAPYRLAIGAANGIYESLDAGDTLNIVAEELRPASSTSVPALAYGSSGAPDLLYIAGCVGTSCSEGGDDGIYVRRALGAAVSLVRANSGGFVAQGVTLDSRVPAQVFAFENASGGVQNLLRSVDSGVSWTPIKGDLPASAGLVRTLLHVHLPSGPALLAGADTGVYISTEAQAYQGWSLLGNGLPKAPVFELDYDATRHVLLAGTLGRGSYTLALPQLRANPGWSGIWYDPATDGQGFQFDVIPETGQLVVAWYTHTPEPLPRTRNNLQWFTGVGPISQGVANVSLVRSRGRFDAPNNVLESAGSISVQFLDCRNAIVSSNLNVAGTVLPASIRLQRLSSDSVCEAWRTEGDAALATLPAPSAVDQYQYGITGTWYNPATDGQGMLVEYLPQSGQVLLGWYTYDYTDSAEGAQPPLWLTALGPASGNRATLAVTLTRGGGFLTPAAVTRSTVGTLTLTVQNCTALSADYELTIDGQSRTGRIPLQRLSSAALCKTPP